MDILVPRTIQFILKLTDSTPKKVYLKRIKHFRRYG
jgi:hypothetical protein